MGDYFEGVSTTTGLFSKGLNDLWKKGIFVPKICFVKIVICRLGAYVMNSYCILNWVLQRSNTSHFVIFVVPEKRNKISC